MYTKRIREEEGSESRAKHGAMLMDLGDLMKACLIEEGMLRQYMQTELAPAIAAQVMKQVIPHMAAEFETRIKANRRMSIADMDSITTRRISDPDALLLEAASPNRNI